MNNLTPTSAIKLLTLIADAPWAELEPADRLAFGDAGPDARICELGRTRGGMIAELLDIRHKHDTCLMMIIGGDSLQIEIHGITEQGEPICEMLPLIFQEG